MTKFKKLLALACVAAIMLTVFVFPASAFTGSTLTLPSKMTLIDDFEGELSVVGWTTAGTAIFEKSSDEVPDRTAMKLYRSYHTVISCCHLCTGITTIMK